MSQVNVPHDIHVVSSWPELITAGDELRFGPIIDALYCGENLGVQRVF